jgi:tRNA (mo5U34)-methyltransferase
MIDYSEFFSSLTDTTLAPLQTSKDAVEQGLSPQRYGDLPRWYEAMAALPDLSPSHVDLQKGVRIGHKLDASPAEHELLQQQLRNLIPWRKGPFDVFGIYIDTEWRSDWKWERLQPHITSLKGRSVLDVGCGNGYHCLRMFGEGARRVVGIDPSPRFVVQFYMIKKYLGAIAVDVLPVGIEALPAELNAFDTTFSMGVLYHRRSPMDHLRELKDTLRPGGELVLETLIIDGKLGDTLVPEGRYAMMNNVWFIPSSATLASWLTKTGFEDVHIVGECVTTLAEQRSTDWMTFHSLSNFLDPHDSSRTVEGHPAPKRAVLVARKPE